MTLYNFEEELKRIHNLFETLSPSKKAVLNLNNLNCSYKAQLKIHGLSLNEIEEMWNECFLFPGYRSKKYKGTARLVGYYWMDKGILNKRLVLSTDHTLKQVLEDDDPLSCLSILNVKTSIKYKFFLGIPEKVTEISIYNSIKRMGEEINELLKTTRTS